MNATQQIELLNGIMRDLSVQLFNYSQRINDALGRPATPQVLQKISESIAEDAFGGLFSQVPEEEITAPEASPVNRRKYPERVKEVIRISRVKELCGGIRHAAFKEVYKSLGIPYSPFFVGSYIGKNYYMYRSDADKIIKLFKK